LKKEGVMRKNVKEMGKNLGPLVRIAIAAALILILVLAITEQTTRIDAHSTIQQPAVQPHDTEAFFMPSNLADTASRIIARSTYPAGAADSDSQPVSENTSSQTIPWGLERVVSASNRAANQGNGVKIAILDTGIDTDHPDLRIAGGVSFVAGSADFDDNNGHGTMVAGIIGALDNNAGVIGVAPEADIYAVKVISQDGKGDTAAVVKGIEWSIANGMLIINLSFGDPNQLPSDVVNALQKAYDEGMVIIAGAGNRGCSGLQDSICYPARYEMVISVGSTDSSNQKADFSSSGPRLDIMAPGKDIVSCNNEGNYSPSGGTSFSAAYVSGVAALLINAGVTDNREIGALLKNNAQDLGAPGWDAEYGFGLIDAGSAIDAASIVPAF
jgi:subtilisin family serine protease